MDSSKKINIYLIKVEVPLRSVWNINSSKKKYCLETWIAVY